MKRQRCHQSGAQGVDRAGRVGALLVGLALAFKAAGMGKELRAVRARDLVDRKEEAAVLDLLPNH